MSVTYHLHIEGRFVFADKKQQLYSVNDLVPEMDYRVSCIKHILDTFKAALQLLDNKFYDIDIQKFNEYMFAYTINIYYDCSEELKFKKVNRLCDIFAVTALTNDVTFVGSNDTMCYLKCI